MCRLQLGGARLGLAGLLRSRKLWKAGHDSGFVAQAATRSEGPRWDAKIIAMMTAGDGGGISCDYTLTQPCLSPSAAVVGAKNSAKFPHLDLLRVSFRSTRSSHFPGLPVCSSGLGPYSIEQLQGRQRGKTSPAEFLPSRAAAGGGGGRTLLRPAINTFVWTEQRKHLGLD